ncbi:MAG: DoxX family membrane protein [Siphonobacter sp.]
MNQLSFLIARLAIGMSFLGHGLVRLPKLGGFSAWMVGKFKDSLLPEALVIPFSYALPFAEFAVGLFIILGWFTKEALVAGGIVVIILIFGSSMVEDWGSIPSQLLHILFVVGLLSYEKQYNAFSLDKRF